MLTFNRGISDIVKRLYIIIYKKQYQLCCSNYQFY